MLRRTGRDIAVSGVGKRRPAIADQIAGVGEPG
jgi:hypothetical protein